MDVIVRCDVHVSVNVRCARGCGCKCGGVRGGYM